MNKRVEAYLEEHLCLYYIGEYGHPVKDPHYEMYREEVEGLIELVVQECSDMMITNQSIDKDPNWNRALRETSKKIKQHYGVEQ